MRGQSLLLLLCVALSAHAAPVSFRQEVMAVLSRAGCNQGACHGNFNGKGGFRLSLRGENPDMDLQTLTRDMQARRTDTVRPAESLILRKATGRVPHEGGPRFPVDSAEYRILRDWIAGGCRDDNPPKLLGLSVSPRSKILFEPAGQVKIDVVGHFADGTNRNLTHLVVFEPTVVGTVNIAADGTMTKLRHGELNIIVRYLDRQVPVTLAFLPARESFTWSDGQSANPVDKHLAAQWKSLRLTPSPVADDSMFLRRVYLDTLGILPTPEEVQAFLGDETPDKRERLIDALLRRPEFADFGRKSGATCFAMRKSPSTEREFASFINGSVIRSQRASRSMNLLGKSSPLAGAPIKTLRPISIVRSEIRICGPKQSRGFSRHPIAMRKVS